MRSPATVTELWACPLGCAEEPLASPPTTSDGRTRVRLAAPTPLDIARNLAGWGAMIEVVEPRSVQAELARIGAELTARYPGRS